MDIGTTEHHHRHRGAYQTSAAHQTGLFFWPWAAASYSSPGGPTAVELESLYRLGYPHQIMDAAGAAVAAAAASNTSSSNSTADGCPAPLHQMSPPLPGPTQHLSNGSTSALMQHHHHHQQQQQQQQLQHQNHGASQQQQQQQHSMLQQQAVQQLGGALYPHTPVGSPPSHLNLENNNIGGGGGKMSSPGSAGSAGGRSSVLGGGGGHMPHGNYPQSAEGGSSSQTSEKQSAAKGYKCKICQQLCFSRHDLAKHNANVHKQDPRPYRCEQCGRQFSTSAYLSQHRRIHLGVKPYACRFCDRRFTQLSHVQQHERIHTGEKPYKCCTCYKCFTQMSNLQSHQRQHMKGKPCRCEHCFMCFDTQDELDTHVQAKHAVHKYSKVLVCPICSKNYNSETYLNKHIEKHRSDTLARSGGARPGSLAGGTTCRMETGSTHGGVLGASPSGDSGSGEHMLNHQGINGIRQDPQKPPPAHQGLKGRHDAGGGSISPDSPPPNLLNSTNGSSQPPSCLTSPTLQGIGVKDRATAASLFRHLPDDLFLGKGSSSSLTSAIHTLPSVLSVADKLAGNGDHFPTATSESSLAAAAAANQMSSTYAAGGGSTNQRGRNACLSSAAAAYSALVDHHHSNGGREMASSYDMFAFPNFRF